MEILFSGGPIDGLPMLFVPQMVPKAIEVHHRGCPATGFFVSFYSYCKQSKTFQFDGISLEPEGLPNRMDVYPSEWLPLEGSVKEGGGVWSVWEPAEM